MTQLFARELFNGLLTVTTFCIAMLVGYRLIYEYFSVHSSVPYRRRPEVRYCLAMFVCFSAECVQRAWVFILLKEQVAGQKSDWWQQLYGIPLGAAMVATFGGLCIIRVLAPRGHGIKAVAASIVAGLIFLFIQM